MDKVQRIDYIERKRKDAVERFFMPPSLNSFIYELNKKKDVEIILDIREIYSSPDWDRNYEIFEENGHGFVYMHDGKSGWSPAAGWELPYLFVNPDSSGIWQDVGSRLVDVNKEFILLIF